MTRRSVSLGEPTAAAQHVPAGIDRDEDPMIGSSATQASIGSFKSMKSACKQDGYRFMAGTKGPNQKLAVKQPKMLPF